MKRATKSLIFLFLVLLFWIFFHPLAISAEFNVFKKTYTRETGKPKTVTDPFIVLNSNTTWTLRATVKKVSSATVILNGVEILHPNDFNQNISFIEIPVTILSSNTIAVEVGGKPGGELTIEIMGIDNSPPVADWLAPAEGEILNTQTVTAQLQLTDDIAGLHPASLQILLDGASVTTAFSPLNQPTLSATLQATLTVTEGIHTLRAEVSDLAGQSVSASVSFTIITDTTSPTISNLTPADGSTIDDLQPIISATFSDETSGIDTTSIHLTFDGLDVTTESAVTEASIGFIPTTALADGNHTVQLQVADQAGNLAMAQATFTIPPLTVTITSPANSSIFTTSPIRVTGTINRNTVTVTVNGVAAIVSNGGFFADVPLPRDGNHIITAVAIDAADKTDQASTTVVLDTIPPTVIIDSPPEGFTTSEETIAIAGLVDDVITASPTVTVNGIFAVVENGSFIAMDVPLNEGSNLITAVSTDGVGNIGTAVITVNRAALPGLRLQIQSGQAQSSVISTALPNPLVVQLLDRDNFPVQGRDVLLEVSRGDGTMNPVGGGDAIRSLFVRTDGNGETSVLFTLGSRTGAGNNRVRASVAGGLSFVEFCATGTSGPPDRIHIIPDSNQQTGVVNRPLGEPFAAVVSDNQGNPLTGVSVDFEVVEGGGNLEGSTEITVNTDGDGIALALLTLGPEPGTANNVVTAAFLGQIGSPIEFVASGVAPGPVADTTFSGIVLDNNDEPLQNARAIIAGVDREALTDEGGQFIITMVPPGSQRLFIDASAIIDMRGRIYPNLEFDVNIISGVNNSLGFPIYLPPLATEPTSLATVTGPPATDVVLRMPGVPEATLTLLAGTIVSNENGPASPTNPITVSLSRVNNDRVPMPPPNGSVFLLAGTTQPAGTRFDPPAPICVPNAGMNPGAQVDIFSFDHDVGQFVSIGFASVSEDGSVICSDPGFGIRKAGWHGAVPPRPPTTTVESWRIAFIDRQPDYALGDDEDTSTISDNDSDNYFLRQHDASTGVADYENLDVYYSILPAGVPITDVKIHIYKENTNERIQFDDGKDYLEGEKDGNSFKTGNNLHVTWPDVRDASGNFRNVGFYRLELEVAVAGLPQPKKTPINDGNPSLPGWQCPQRGLAIHDIVYKHRPVVFMGANETVAPNGPVYPFSSGIIGNYRLRESQTLLDGPAWDLPLPNYSNFGDFPNRPDNFDDIDVKYPVLQASINNDPANVANHYIDVLDSNRGSAAGIPFLCHRGHPTAHTNYVFVQYWMYETSSHAPYNTTGVKNNTFTHEADWEIVQICVQLQDPSDLNSKSKWFSPYATTASQHFYGQTLAWRRDKDGPGIIDQRYAQTAENGNRIEVFIAENAHATYFRGGTFDADIFDGLGTQVQYNTVIDFFFDQIGAPSTQVNYSLLPLNFKNQAGIYDWPGKWGGKEIGIPFVNGPFLSTRNIEGGGTLQVANNPVQFHNLCRKLINGSQDSETELQ